MSVCFAYVVLVYKIYISIYVFYSRTDPKVLVFPAQTLDVRR